MLYLIVAQYGRTDDRAMAALRHPVRHVRLLPLSRSADLLGKYAARGDLRRLEQLAASGADIRGFGYNGETPLQNAVVSDQAAAVRFLLAHGAAIDQMGPDGTTALGVAIKSKRLDMARLLLDAGADPNMGSGLLPLHDAARSGNAEACALLLQHHADPGGAGCCATTPLHLAATGNYPAVIRLLLRAGANIDASDADGYTPLLLAIRRRSWEAARLLIEKGADVCVVDCEVHATPLHWAALGRDLPTVELLVQHGASLTARDKFGRTPADYARLNAQAASDYQLVEKVLVP